MTDEPTAIEDLARLRTEIASDNWEGRAPSVTPPTTPTRYRTPPVGPSRLAEVRPVKMHCRRA